ncbi:MAG: hypothetical protein WA705_31440 [Candidatus Ozemobacteraceae bacterium]
MMKILGAAAAVAVIFVGFSTGLGTGIAVTVCLAQGFEAIRS